MADSYVLFDPASGPPPTRSERIRRLFAYWDGLRNGRPFPRRIDIDPAAIKPLLPHLMLTDIFYDPFRVRYRLVGTEIARFAKFDFTNRYADELEFQDGETADWTIFYRRVVEARRTGFGITSWTVDGGSPRWIEFLICPLSSDGNIIDRCISVEDYEHLNPMQIDSLPPVFVR